MLKADIQAEILALYYGKKKSVRSIARILGIGRHTVTRVIQRRQVRLVPKVACRSSMVDTHKSLIENLLESDPQIPAIAVLQQIRKAGFTGGYSTLTDWLAKERWRYNKPKREAFLRLEFDPGECAQVDWGEFGNVFGDGVKIHCFVIVLCYSRLLYVEFTRSEKFEEFIRCHENAFEYFGGVPKECWYDNLATAVTDRMGNLVRFNSRFMAYLGHHHVRPHACNVARGNEKGRVEDAIKYIRSNFWPGREFFNFEDLCKQASQWRDKIANCREHRSTRKIPLLHFETKEKQMLLPMNTPAYDTDEVNCREVPPQFHIIYETNRYSVPWTLVGVVLTMRVNANEIRFYYREHQVAYHERSYQKHKVFTKSGHQNGLLERKPGGSRDSWRVIAVKQIGPVMDKYLELIRSGQRSIRQELAKILILSTIYGNERVNAACEILLKSAIVGVENLEQLLKAKHSGSSMGTPELNPEPLTFKREKLNRVVPTVDLRRYDAYLFESSQNHQPTTPPMEDKNHATIQSTPRDRSADIHGEDEPA